MEDCFLKRETSLLRNVATQPYLKGITCSVSKILQEAPGSRRKFCTKMMKIFLLFAVLIPSQCTSAQSCTVDNVINLMIKSSTDSLVSSILSKVDLTCTNVVSRGADVSCPSGYKATACACGMACGSWDIRGNSDCHCQCQNIDWTSARCCRFALVG
ncbi:resistin [Heteronotia binoei]|uniref:resistin n=1 Tax=Heteronotia binoei TaxID=13085 RepID=UPI00292EA9D4|nr:resistin [Heteronotia binoei]